ncbi:MAG: glycosyl hydrolase family 28-related protein, partial [Geminicoccaceae bacterium]
MIEALEDGGAEIRGGEVTEPPPGMSDGGVSVTQYGAKGDGETDDTEAIQRALDAGAGTRVLFPHRGPWKTTRKVLIKGNCFVQGYGGACLHWYGDGGIGVSESVGGIQYLRVEGFEVNNQSGDGVSIGLGLNELNNRGYPGGPNVPIDVAIVCYNKFIRSKVLMNTKPGRMWLCDNLIE